MDTVRASIEPCSNVVGDGFERQLRNREKSKRELELEERGRDERVSQDAHDGQYVLRQNPAHTSKDAPEVTSAACSTAWASQKIEPSVRGVGHRLHGDGPAAASRTSLTALFLSA